MADDATTGRRAAARHLIGLDGLRGIAAFLVMFAHSRDFVLVAVVVVALSTLTYLFVERPAMRLRGRLSGRATSAPSPIAARDTVPG